MRRHLTGYRFRAQWPGNQTETETKIKPVYSPVTRTTSSKVVAELMVEFFSGQAS
jgi:hypothetical protein